MQQKILDVACGSRMFYFDKENPNVLFLDNRNVETTLSDGRKLSIHPDLLADFKNLPFEDNSFHMVVFDPPHLIRAGKKSWLAQKYGVLPTDWQKEISQGFKECFRVLKPNGTLIFKWNEEQVKLTEILKLTPNQPIIGNRRSKTHWLVFMKEELENE